LRARVRAVSTQSLTCIFDCLASLGRALRKLLNSALNLESRPSDAVRTSQTPQLAAPSALLVSTLRLVELHRVAGEQTASDHQRLNLVGTLADHHQRRVAVVALNGELRHIAIAAEHAHRIQRDLAACL